MNGEIPIHTSNTKLGKNNYKSKSLHPIPTRTPYKKEAPYVHGLQKCNPHPKEPIRTHQNTQTPPELTRTHKNPQEPTRPHKTPPELTRTHKNPYHPVSIFPFISFVSDIPFVPPAIAGLPNGNNKPHLFKGGIWGGL